MRAGPGLVGGGDGPTLARACPPTGEFVWDLRSNQLMWSAEMYRIYGYPPNAVHPTPELVLEHKHPSAQAAASALLTEVRSQAAPFSLYHKIITAHGKERTVLVVGRGERHPETNELVRCRGFLVDLTDDERRVTAEAVQAATAHRAAIEQAKGMIMLIRQVDEDAAFALLRWHSMRRNIKLHLFAAQLLAVVREHTGERTAPADLINRILDDGYRDS